MPKMFRGTGIKECVLQPPVLLNAGNVPGNRNTGVGSCAGSYRDGGSVPHLSRFSRNLRSSSVNPIPAVKYRRLFVSRRKFMNMLRASWLTKKSPEWRPKHDYAQNSRNIRRTAH